MTDNNTESLVRAAIEGLQEKKAVDIVTVNLTNIDNTFCKYFIICNGTSNTHVDALADSVIELVRKKCNDKPIHVEGLQTSQWVLVDYADVIVHVFQKEFRDLYQLEDLWADAIIKRIED